MEKKKKGFSGQDETFGPCTGAWCGRWIARVPKLSWPEGWGIGQNRFSSFEAFLCLSISDFGFFLLKSHLLFQEFYFFFFLVRHGEVLRPAQLVREETKNIRSRETSTSDSRAFF
jgi:hypothetical protein